MSSIISNPESFQSFSETLFKSFDFSSSQLSTFKDHKNLSPVLLAEASFKLSSSSPSGILQKSFDEGILKDDKSQEIFNILLARQVIEKTSPTCSDCGGEGIYYQKCSHYTCNNCLYSSLYCSACRSPRPLYNFDFDYHLCLKCKSFGKRPQTCKHYCSDCIISILRLGESFKCSVCSASYVAEGFKEIPCICENCNRKGNLMEDLFFNICSNHLMCFDCVQTSCKYSTCLICKSFLSIKEVYKIKKKLRKPCESCLKLKEFENFPLKACCKKTICEDCLVKKGCC